MQREALVPECSQALQQLGQVLERSIEGSLENLLEGLEACISRTLAAEQRKPDFQPTDMEADTLDRPTIACQMVVGLVKALKLDAEEHLRSEPCHELLAEVRAASTLSRLSGVSVKRCMSILKLVN
jgi:hypothetical protein